ncbi:uncharacterized protein [Onthophagus taurus]|uniref:uncharacterized protein isoform X2 n=1 Tax=Onthophagus taurus TaxID=166361 RepID=UPI0039BE9EF8
MQPSVLKIFLLICFLTKTRGMLININASYFCFLPNETLTQTHHVCDSSYYYQPTNKFGPNENYNETHVWFDVNHQLCTAKLDDVVQIAICNNRTQIYAGGDVTVPPIRGKDVYGNPIKHKDQFNENLTQTHHVCDSSYYYQPTNKFGPNENYNETHVWFDVNHQLCTAKLDDVVQIAICEENGQIHASGDVTVPPIRGKDVYGNPIKHKDQFN